MQTLLAKSICRLEALGLIVLAAMLVRSTNNGPYVATVLLAVAVALALLQRWAFWAATAVFLLFIIESIAVGMSLPMLRPSMQMYGVGDRFSKQVASFILLERPALFLHGLGLPEAVARVVLCLAAAGALAYAHRTLRIRGVLGPFKNEGLMMRIAHYVSAVSKIIVGVGVLLITFAVWKDPPGTGHSPGLPAAGTLAIVAVIFIGPFIVAGAVGWAVAAMVIRSQRRAAIADGSIETRPSAD